MEPETEHSIDDAGAPRARRRGFKLGPLVWVPEWRSSPNDPWAHRKGEPRPLALFWALYLMVAALLTLFAVRSLTMPTTEQFVFGCRGMLTLVAIGLTVLWPTMRLSQIFPAAPSRSVIADLGVLLVPVQAVLWPMMLLTRWALPVTAALALMLASWAVLAASIVRAAYVLEARASRPLFTLACIAIAAGAPALQWSGGVPFSGRVHALLSPVTAVFALSEAPPSFAPVMQPVEWFLAALPALAGGVIWIALPTRRPPPLASAPVLG